MAIISHRIRLGLSNLKFIKPSNIEYVISDGSYTYIYGVNGSEILISYRIRKVIEEINKCNKENILIRCHRKYAINIKYVNQISFTNKPAAIMNSGKKIEISNSHILVLKMELINLKIGKTLSIE